nr:hypothetical protein [Prevotella sp.]
MKKILLSSLFFLIAFVANAQGIYTKVKKYDKFDDVVWEKDVKTIIDKGLSKITIETKGKKTVEYTYYDGPLFSIHDGRQDSLSNIVSNIYGYEDQYYIFPKDTVDKVTNHVLELCKDAPDSIMTSDLIEALVRLQMMPKVLDAPTIVFRTISKFKNFFEYDTDLVWIRFRDGSRIIYSKR